jgi:hypothetical protein
LSPENEAALQLACEAKQMPVASAESMADLVAKFHPDIESDLAANIATGRKMMAAHVLRKAGIVPRL